MTKKQLCIPKKRHKGKPKKGVPGLSAPERMEILKHRPLLREKEVTELYGIKGATLRSWRTKGIGPEFMQREKGTTVYYTHEAIRTYMGTSKTSTRVKNAA